MQDNSDSIHGSLLESGGSLTWLNHFSIQAGLRNGVQYEKFTAIGVDGTLLRTLLGRQLKHSSADTYLPRLIDGRKLKVLLIGGDLLSAERHAEWFGLKFPLCEVIGSMPGFEIDFDELKESLLISRPNLIILGLGPGVQDVAALKLSDLLKKENFWPLIATCGGWLDQLSNDNYFPRWSSLLRLNWLVRLIREPRRLWKRYSFWAIRAFFIRNQLEKSLQKVNFISGVSQNPLKP
jgi:UDP-N-acetyl-D-mannosaminuronic acid transferase (WecB/TagA/CpsF family)